MADTLIGVIHDHRQLISEESISSAQDKVTYLLLDILDLDALYGVMKGQGLRVDMQARRPPFLGWNLSGTTSSRIDGTFGTQDGVGGNLTSTADTVIGQAKCVQLGERIFIGLRPLILIENGFIPFEAKGLKRTQYGIGGARDQARAIEVFHTHQPGSPVSAGLRIAAQGSD